MSKDSNIANIVKQLNSLNIEQTGHILNYIKQAKKDNAKKKSEQEEEEDTPYLKFYNKKGVRLSVGDRVVLLTSGVDNDKGKEATVHTLPKYTGKYITLIPARYDNHRFPSYINKLSKSIRKIR